MLETLYQSLKAAKQLPTPPGVALRILQLVQSENTSLDQVTEVITTDPALVAKILKYISSPVFGLGLAGATLPEAVARIGTRGIQTLALSFSLVSQQHRKACPSFNFDKHWSHSLASSVAARQLATLAGEWSPEEAFITGLMSRIGQLVLATALPAKYEPLLRKKPGDNSPLEEREHAALGADHFIVGMALLKDWQLPEGVWQTIGWLSPRLRPQTLSRAQQVLMTADTVATFVTQEAKHSFTIVDDLAREAEATLGIAPDDFRTLLGRLVEEWMTLGSVLAVPTDHAPDLAAIEREAEEHRTALRLAAEMEISSLRNENEQLSKIAHRDRLTGLHNRRAFDEALPAALEAAQQSGQPVALLIGDIDHFKSVNDTHGHPTGDAVLRHVACALNDKVGTKGHIFRYGGEEFAIIAPDRTLEQALAFAETMRVAVESSPCVHEGRTINPTISIGLAFAIWPDRPAEPADLIDVADQRLYDAKRTGRNRCCAEVPSTKREWNPAHNPAREAALPKGAGGFFKKLSRFLPTGGK